MLDLAHSVGCVKGLALPCMCGLASGCSRKVMTVVCRRLARPSGMTCGLPPGVAKLLLWPQKLMILLSAVKCLLVTQGVDSLMPCSEGACT